MSRSEVPVARFLVLILVVWMVAGWPSGAADVPLAPADEAPGLADPYVVVRSGMPVLPAVISPGMPGRELPFRELDRDPAEGVRHGWVATSSGRFGFGVLDLELPSRVPFRVGRVYDAGLVGALPGPSHGGEPRASRDLGPNWILSPVSVLLAVDGGYLLLTDEAGVIPYVPDGAGGYRPDPDRPLRFGRLEPEPGGGWRVRLADGRVRTYRLVEGEANYWLVREEDGAGNALEYRYRDGYLWRIESTDGSWVEFSRPMWGAAAPAGLPATRVVRMEDSAGRVVELEYDGEGKLVGSRGPCGGRWTWEWDGARHLARVLDPSGRPVFEVVTDGEDRALEVRFGGARTTFAYGAGRTEVTDAAGGRWTYEHDAAGFTTRIEDPEGGVVLVERDEVTHDVVRVVDAAGGEHRFEHDGSHRLVAYEGPEVDGERPRWEYLRDAEGRLLSVRTPCGTVTELVRDDRGLLVAERVDADRDGTAEIERRWERDAATGDVVARVDAEGRRTEYARDARGLVVEVRPECVDGVCPVIRLERDAAGRVTRLGWPAGEGEWSWWTIGWHGCGIPASVEDPLGRRWEIALGPAGRLAELRTPAGGTWRYAWDAAGHPVRVEDPLGHVHRWEYDGAGRLVSWIDPEGGTWRYRWDGAGRLREYEDPEGNAWTLSRDGAGRVTGVVLPGGGEIEISRDAAGRIVERRLPGEVAERYAWDAEGNLLEVERTFPEGDRVGRDLWRYEWDGRGLPLSLEAEIDGGEGSVLSRTLSWEWDRSGLLARWTDGDGVTREAERDARGRLVRIGDGVAVQVEVERDPWTGAVTRRRDGSVEETYVRDAAGALAAYEERESGRVVRRVSYGRDAAGRVVSVVDELAEPPAETAIERDLLDRVVEVHRADGSGERYLRDAAGRVRFVERWTADGNEDREEYVRDAAGRLVAVTSRGSSVTYLWRFGVADGLAEVERNGTGELDRRTRMRVDADGRVDLVREQVDGTWVEVRRYRWMPGAGTMPVSEDAWDREGMPERHRRWLGGPGMALAAYDGAAGGASWEPALELAWWELERGSWRRWLVGRRDSAVEELPLVTGTEVPQSALGGVRVLGGVEPPTAESLAVLVHGKMPGGEVGRRSLSGLPSPGFEDRELGFLGRESIELLPPTRRSVGVPIGCVEHPGETVGVMRCPGDFEVRKVFRPGSHGDGEVLCLGLPSECDSGGGGFAGSSCGPDQRSQPLEPLRNPVRHPLGVSLSNGEFAFGVTDLVAPGRGGVDLVLSRTYRHQSWRRGLLGMGWTFGLLDERLVNASCGDAILWYREDGSFVTFPRLYEDGEVERRDYGRILRWTPQGAEHSYYEVRRPDGTVIRFEDLHDPPVMPGVYVVKGYPVRVTRPGGAALEIAWERHEEPGDTGCGASWVEPVSAKLWSCDDDARTNPLGAAACEGSRVLLAEATFATERRCDSVLVTAATLRERRPDGSWHERRLEFSYGSWSNEAGEKAGPRVLSSVEIRDVSGGGDAETVASYRYGFDLGEESLRYDSRLREVLNGAGERVMRIEYDLDSEGRKKDTVRRIEAAGHEVRFDYHVDGRRFGSVTVTEAGRATTHHFDEHGHQVKVDRPDDSVVEYEYDSVGRMTRAIAPRGADEDRGSRPEKVWVYAATDRWGAHVEHPVKYGELPAGFAHGEVATWYCYEMDPLTGAVRLSRGPIERTDREEPECVFRDAEGNLLPDVTEVVLGWQDAAPSAEAGKDTADPDLEAYLERWGFHGDEGDPLPLRGTGEAHATWPWLAPVEEWSPGATERVGASGEREPVSPVERRLVTTAYNGEGLPVEVTTWIASSGASERTFVRRECRYWLEAGELGPAPGTREGFGRLAQREVLGEDVACPASGDGEVPAGALLSRERYGYDVHGNVIEVRTGQDAGRWIVSRKELDYRGRLLAEWTESGDGALRGPVTRRRYDRAGRPLQQRVEWSDEGVEHGLLTEWEYDPETHLVRSETTWPDSTWLAEPSEAVGAAWEGTGTPAKRVYERDELGNVTREATLLESSPERWSVVTRSWDKLNRLVEERSWTEPQADPHVEEPSGGWTARRVWRDGAGRVVAEQSTGSVSGGEVVAGRTVLREYDGLDRVLLERLCAEAERGGSSAPECTRTLVETERWYDRWGKVSEERVRGYAEDPALEGLYGWLKVDRDSTGQWIERRTGWSPGSAVLPAECPAGGSETCRWRRVRKGRDALGRAVLEAVEQPGGTWRVSEVELDGLGRKVAVEDPLGNRVEYERDLLGRVTVKRLVEPPSEWEEDGREVETEFGYDGLGRPEVVRLPDPGTGEVREVRRGYDGRGLPAWERTPLSTGEGSHETRWEYDGFGRKVKELRRMGAGGEWTEDWRETRYGYDTGGRLRWIEVDPDREGEQAPVQRTEYRYDGAGRRTERVLPNGRVQEVEYDALGRAWETRWKSSAGMCGEAGVGCVTIRSTWDQVGRRTRREVELIGVATEHYAGVREERWWYDPMGRVTRSRSEGELGGEEYAVEVEHAYDNAGAPVEETLKAGGDASWTLRREYDLLGRRSLLRYPEAGGSLVLEYEYDDLDRVTRLGASPERVPVEQEYVGVGRLVRARYGDGTEWRVYREEGGARRTLWDEALRRTGGMVVRPGDGEVLFEEEMGYDAEDRVTHVVWSHGRSGEASEAQEYEYDEAGRLVSFRQGLWDEESGGVDPGDVTVSHEWRLDALGNWRKHWEGDRSPEEVPEQQIDGVNAYLGWSTGEDADGDGVLDLLELEYDGTRGFLWRRQVDGEWRRYVHDGLGRLVGVQREVEGGWEWITRYGYDAEGRLAFRQEGTGARTWMVRDGDRAVVEVEEGVGAVRRNAWLGGRLVRTEEAAPGGWEEPVYAHGDRLGSIVLTTRGDGSVVSVTGRSTYDPYGKEVSLPSWGGGRVSVPYGFAGARWDAAAGLYRMGARWYDPEMGRFLEQDPIGERGGLNLYAYVGSSPVMWVDPTGLMPGSLAQVVLLRLGGVPSGMPKGLGEGLDKNEEEIKKDGQEIQSHQYATHLKKEAEEKVSEAAKNVGAAWAAYKEAQQAVMEAQENEADVGAALEKLQGAESQLETAIKEFRQAVVNARHSLGPGVSISVSLGRMASPDEIRKTAAENARATQKIWARLDKKERERFNKWKPRNGSWFCNRFVADMYSYVGAPDYPRSRYPAANGGPATTEEFLNSDGRVGPFRRVGTSEDYAKGNLKLEPGDIWVGQPREGERLGHMGIVYPAYGRNWVISIRQDGIHGPFDPDGPKGSLRDTIENIESEGFGYWEVFRHEP